jgi:hypothetical protein
MIQKHSAEMLVFRKDQRAICGLSLIAVFLDLTSARNSLLARMLRCLAQGFLLFDALLI